MSDPITQTSKFLSYVLRHHPESIGISLDRDGWVDVAILLAQCEKHNRLISRELLDEVVANNNKKRFTFSPDRTRIRAAQGHSTAQVDLQFQAVTPPDILYHGTAQRNLASILAQGLVSGSRHHVHLSADTETAKQVGARHGKPLILRVDAAKMAQSGYAFYCSDNGVWLTKTVPPEFLSEM